MSIKVVLFDLDGTLLPMDQEVFVKAYFTGLAKALEPYGYQREKLIQGIQKGLKAMFTVTLTIIAPTSYITVCTAGYAKQGRNDNWCLH